MKASGGFAVSSRPDISVRPAARRWQRGIARALLLAGALAGMTLGSVANAQIAFRSASSSTQPIPTFRAAASSASSIGFRGAGTVAPLGAGNVTPGLPAGWQPNDLHILIVEQKDNIVSTVPAGWTPVTGSPANSGLTHRAAIWWRIAVGGDTNPLVTHAAGNSIIARIIGFSGVDTVTPFDVANSFTVSAADNTVEAAAITTVTANTMLVFVAMMADNHAALGTPAGSAPWTQAFFSATSLGSDSSIGAYYGLRSAAGVQPALVSTVTYQSVAPTSTAAISHGAQFALRPVPMVLAIDKPAGTVTNDVMIASIGPRINSPGIDSRDIGITPPAGWTLAPNGRGDNLTSTSSALAVYWKLAGASEPASYTWTFSCINVSGGNTCVTLGFNSAVGGIVSFSNVDITAASPINIDGKNDTAAAGTSIYTPDVTTTVANAMLVTSHSVANNDTWQSPPPGPGMTEAFQVKTASEAIQVSRALQAAAGPTGQKQALDTGPDAVDVGLAHILALRPAQQSSITIAQPTVPAATVLNDVMIATIGFRPATLTVTTVPAGWALVRRIDSTDTTLGGAPSSLEVYWKVMAGEAGPYTWTYSAAGYLAGGILSFSGVDTTSPTPIDIDAGNCTPQAPPVPVCQTPSLSFATPSVVTTMANTMLVTSHTYASAGTWTPPPAIGGDAAMTEAVDVQHGNQSLSANYVPHAAAGATGVKTATASSDADIGNAHILALKPPSAVVAGGFNAYETSTAAGAITGVIKTKIAGASVSVDMIALNAAKTAIATTFTGTVRVEVLNASDNSGALDANGCRPTWTVIQTLSPDPAFIAGDNGRKTISFTQANSYPNARLRITFPAGAPTVTGCSNDNFAIRPNTLASFAVTDTDWQTTGAPGARALNLLTFAAITPIHKAGRPFSVRATAVNTAAATTGNYTGAPTATLSTCVGAACTATFGTLTLTTTFVAGQLASDVASYDNVGSFALQLVDSTFASVDNADSTPLEREITSGAAINVGRFVPDHFAVALTPPVFGTKCAGVGSVNGFTYIGQAFNYTTAPVITVTAQGFANNTTTLYNTLGSWFRITNADITPATQAARYSAATGTLDPMSGWPAVASDPTIASSGAGVGTLTFSSGTGLFFTRSTPTAPASPYDADISLAINVIDADGVILATNPARFGTATAGNGIAFSDGNALTTNDKQMRFGRLAIRNANGSQLVPLPVQVEAQYWSGAPTNAFITNAADSCTSIAAGNVAMSNFTQNLAACETAISGGGVLSAGRKTLQLAAPGSANNGSVDLTVNLGASASGNTCTAVGAGPGPLTTTANLPHLQGNWTGVNYDQNPTARATFGVFKGAEEVIFIRENF
jgi:hypothetical protein